VLLVLVVLIPAVAVGWLVWQASENTRLAMEKVYEDARKGYLETGRAAVFDEVVGLREGYDRLVAGTPALERGAVVRSWGQADGFVRSVDTSFDHGGEGGEAEDRDRILNELAGISALRKSGDREQAAARVEALLTHAELGEVRRSDGRMLAPMVAYLAVDLALSDAAVTESRERLSSIVMDDRMQSLMTPAQVQFFLKRVLEWDSDPEIEAAYRFATVSADWVDRSAAHSEDGPLVGTLQLGDLLGIRSFDGREVIILWTKTLADRVQGRFDALPERAGGRLEIHSTADTTGMDPESLAIKSDMRQLVLGSPLEGWVVLFRGDDQVAAMGRAGREVLVLVLVGTFVIGLTGFLSFALYNVIQRQARLAQLKNDLVATVSHELKTPVASIRLLVDTLMRDSEFDPVRVRDYLGLISRENRRLGHLIENFLSFSRMERNKDSFDLQPVGPEGVAREAEEVFRERQSDGAGELRVQVEDDLPLIRADREALQTAVGNLLENAQKYGGQTPRIVLAVKRTTNAVEFSVSDSGNGISKEDQKRIFEKFYQSRTRLSEHVGGVGLGLSIVSFIVDKHGGELRVESEPGQGSVFTIMVPYI